MRAVLLSNVVNLRLRVYDRQISPQERILLRHLVDRGSINAGVAADLLWGGREDGGALCAVKIIHVLIHCLRRRLWPGWEIPVYPHKETGWLLIQTTHMEMAA